jgi:hypothetical protein
LYRFYTAETMIRATTLYTTPQLLEELGKLRVRTAEDTIAQLDTMISQAHVCEDILAVVAKDWRKAVTRLHRITAVDVKDAEERKVEITRRFEHEAAWRLVMDLKFDVANLGTNHGGINEGLNKIRHGLKDVDRVMLDLHVATETAMLAAAWDEKKGEDIVALFDSRADFKDEEQI